MQSGGKNGLESDREKLILKLNEKTQQDHFEMMDGKWDRSKSEGENVKKEKGIGEKNEGLQKDKNKGVTC